MNLYNHSNYLFNFYYHAIWIIFLFFFPNFLFTHLFISLFFHLIYISLIFLCSTRTLTHIHSHTHTHTQVMIIISIMLSFVIIIYSYILLKVAGSRDDSTARARVFSRNWRARVYAPCASKQSRKFLYYRFIIIHVITRSHNNSPFILNCKHQIKFLYKL